MIVAPNFKNRINWSLVNFGKKKKNQFKENLENYIWKTNRLSSQNQMQNKSFCWTHCWLVLLLLNSGTTACPTSVRTALDTGYFHWYYCLLVLWEARVAFLSLLHALTSDSRFCLSVFDWLSLCHIHMPQQPTKLGKVCFLTVQSSSVNGKFQNRRIGIQTVGRKKLQKISHTSQNILNNSNESDLFLFIYFF